MKKILLFALTLSSPFACARPAAAAEFAVPHRLIDVGGRKLNLYCSGTGSPTVVFESPSGSAGWDWWAVQTQVAAKTRACIHDRAGYGFSDPSPRAADAGNAVDDLHALLKAAGIAPPYVLVGNSFGGGSVELYTWQPSGRGQRPGAGRADARGRERAPRRAHARRRSPRPKREIIAFGDACAARPPRASTRSRDIYDDCIGGADPSLPARSARST